MGAERIYIFGLTQLGTVHTAISLVAVAAGLVLFIRDKEITSKTRLGKLYVFMTIVTCLRGFGIFQHGGFGKPHAVGIATLVVIAIAASAEYSSLFGRISRYVSVVGYSATFAFHLIPAMTETATRLPLGAPLVADAEADSLKIGAAVIVAVYLIGATLQVRRLRVGQCPSQAKSRQSRDSTRVTRSERTAGQPQ